MGMTLSSPNGSNGRDGHGRFAQGNPGGPGNPHAAAVGRWRTALAHTVTEDDLRAVIAKLVERAKAGERWAVCELLDRCLGKPVQPVGTAGELETRPVRIALVLDEGPAAVSRDDP